MEELVNNFVMLANKSVLTKAELEEAKGLMVELKKSGLTNAEIAKLSAGRWSVPAKTLRVMVPIRG